MIPRDFVTAWRQSAPWVQDALVEQDLVISRALVDIYAQPLLNRALAFRGGTALSKLYMPATRYSEDIDLVQVEAGPIGDVVDGLRQALSWLGTPSTKQNAGRVTLQFRFTSEDGVPLKLKVEINTREHFSVFERRQVPFSVETRWFAGAATISTFELDELLGTKLRALYQRKKGRDLLDLHVAHDHGATPARIVEAFQRYMASEARPVTRAMFEKNLAEKLGDARFLADLAPLLATTFSWDTAQAVDRVQRLIALLPGEPWRRPGAPRGPRKRTPPRVR